MVYSVRIIINGQRKHVTVNASSPPQAAVFGFEVLDPERKIEELTRVEVRNQSAKKTEYFDVALEEGPTRSATFLSGSASEPRKVGTHWTATIGLPMGEEDKTIYAANSAQAARFGADICDPSQSLTSLRVQVTPYQGQVGVYEVVTGIGQTRVATAVSG